MSKPSDVLLHRAIPGIIAAALALCLPSVALGNTYAWNVSSGTWTTASNWLGNVPYSSDTALIDNGGTATITQSGAICSTLTLGDTRGAGTLNVTSGDLYVGSSLTCGQNGRAAVLESGGMVAVGSSGTLSVGLSVGGSGTYNLSGNAYLTGGYEDVGYSGTGIFTQSGGTNNVGSLYLGMYAGSSGTYGLTGGGQLSAAGEYIGYSSGARRCSSRRAAPMPSTTYPSAAADSTSMAAALSASTAGLPIRASSTAWDTPARFPSRATRWLTCPRERWPTSARWP